MKGPGWGRAWGGGFLHLQGLPGPGGRSLGSRRHWLTSDPTGGLLAQLSPGLLPVRGPAGTQGSTLAGAEPTGEQQPPENPGLRAAAEGARRCHLQGCICHANKSAATRQGSPGLGAARGPPERTRGALSKKLSVPRPQLTGRAGLP